MEILVDYAAIKISVIIPIYNDEKYLEECVKSVMGQSLKEIEIICINDGSTDRSLEILKALSTDSPNIIIINQKNMGAGIARNNGINAARGKFVAFMDGDDYYPSEDVLECLYNTALKENTQVCRGSYSQICRGDIVEQFSGITNQQRVKKSGIVKFSEFAFPYGFTTYIYDREMLVKNDIKFPQYKLYEDPLFLIRVMACVEEFYAISKVVYRHRVSIHRKNYTKDRVLEVLKASTKMLEIAKAKGWSLLGIRLLECIYEGYYPHIYKYVNASEKNVIEQLTAMNCLLDPGWFVNRKELLESFSLQGILDYAVKVGRSLKEFDSVVACYNDVIIYGAGQAGEVISQYLQNERNITIRNFAVTAMKGNKEYLNGIAVKPIENLLHFKNTGLFVVGVAECYRKNIEDNLKAYGVKNICYIDYRMLKVSRPFCCE